ncbi:galectin [Elysia marginata]|uniref:Galectin n=1 Tax=Elysia marginata TaxID=1093978 RepID=A0AAV4FFU4_9GAST|nr:galectin [Elysia marginata]
MKQNMLLCKLLRYHAVYVGLVDTLVFLHMASSSVDFVSKRYESFPDRHFTCGVPLQLLDGEGGGGNKRLTCALACQELAACTSFTFTKEAEGSCAFCPAKNITALVFTPKDNQTESWIRRSGHYLKPVHEQVLDIPGAGAAGGLIVVKGTASTPLHWKRFMDLFNKKQETIMLRFIRFAESPNSNASFIRLNSMFNDTWSVETERNLPLELFPFAEGENYEINFLTTSHGFIVYVNGVYLITYSLSISKAEFIDSMRLKFGPELNYVSF